MLFCVMSFFVPASWPNIAFLSVFLSVSPCVPVCPSLWDALLNSECVPVSLPVRGHARGTRTHKIAKWGWDALVSFRQGTHRGRGCSPRSCYSESKDSIPLEPPLTRARAQNGSRPMAKASETLRSLAEKARRKNLPQRHELVAVALDIGAEAMEHEREWFGKDGHMGTSTDPQFAAANRSVEVAASLALEPLKAGQAGELLPDPQDPTKLRELGYEVVEHPEGYLLRKLPEAAPEGVVRQ